VGTPNVLLEVLIFLLRIWEVSGSYLGPKTWYSDCVFRGFPRSLQVNAGIAPKN
jgi:hypothetical protein